MGDHIEVQITPETPGRPSIRNPFESPNDYHHLREPLVPSPSVFRSKPCKATPPKFNWSIDEMASLLPVHIDPEEIQRQSFYLSQTRMDSDIEEKCQNAIEQFFTKGAIVPSPWAAPETRRATHLYKKSPFSEAISEESEKISVACQTTLSLPLAFDLEKLLGEYYRYEEACDAVQESLSSSSLRRKLFLDGQFSYSSSDSSTPPSPDRANGRLDGPSPYGGGPGAAGDGVEGEALTSVCLSPLAGSRSAQTPSTGQFSSSPIKQGCFRDCSLGSISSPLFPDRSSPAGHASPTVSPIYVDMVRTPVDSGCSPIRSCSPHQLHYQHQTQNTSRPKARPRVRNWASPPLISPILNPKLQEDRDAEEHSSTSSSSSLPAMELDPTSPPPATDSHSAAPERINLDTMEVVKMEEGANVELKKRLEEDEEEAGFPSEHLTSSRMGNASATESSQIFLSLLAEGSSLRYDSSMQVDSGYNTISAGTASLIDGISSDFQSKESISSNPVEEAFPVNRLSKVKGFHPPRCLT
ncbi:protein aurora borealis isoform X2 [Poeciliopsis prolifica]|uniref:protein aurora borealis isoform X2 n=1 Tax=Poeciliopsis prolifica TaxID=188132 RepID=UPI0024136EF4|nr:protein aurora borealis isoform X2 [Poeciliopsis prolifica]